jgi:bifunctional non-homologous end joining protein LigD
LATSITKVPSGDRWIHEVKFNGYRVQVHIANDLVRIFTRRGYDWTGHFKTIAADAWHLNVKSSIIDARKTRRSPDRTQGRLKDFALSRHENANLACLNVLFVT